MGVVYLADDPLIARQVAIKVLWPGADDVQETERLVAEARVSGRLMHPHIVPIFDVGEDDGHPFVVMQFVEGRTLARVIGAPERPSLDVKLRWMAELCDGLDYAHEQRVVHRDIKPSNLLIDAAGRLRILDFGVAKILSTSQISFTSVGTPAYMAPEQYSRAPVDSRTDVFAAGLVLFELITHRRALAGDSPAQILGQIMLGPMPQLADVEPGVDPALGAIYSRAVARDPADRFQSARALGDALAAVRARPTAGPPALPARAPNAVPPETGPPTAATIPSAPRVAAPPVSEPVAPPVPLVEALPSFAAEPPARGWLSVVTTTQWRFALPATALTGLLAAVLMFGPERTAAPPSAGPEAPPPQVSGSPRPPAPMPGPPTSKPAAVGRLRLSADLPGATFTTEIDGRTTTLSALEPNALAPARYEVRAVYTDRDPILGHGDKPVTARQTIDVVANETVAVRFALEAELWRHRFERALARPAGGGGRAVLDRTYRRLKELGAATSADDARYAAAASQQQLVKFVKGDMTTDSGGFERYVKYTRVDIVRIDAAAQRIAMLDGSSTSRELTRGRHDYEVVLEIQYASRLQSLTCTGAFEVAGGPSALELKVDTIVRRPTMQDHRLSAQCQIGGTTPFVPSTGSDPAAGLGTLTIRVQTKGRPVPGATISVGPVFNPPLPTQVSDADGTATFTGLRTGDYRVSAGGEGYRAAGLMVSVGATTTVRTIQLDASLAQATTDDSGRFRIPISPGGFDVQAIPHGRYAMAWFEGVSVTASRGASLDATIRDASGPTVDRLKAVGSDEGGVISGRLRDARGAPLKGVVIKVYPGKGNIAAPAR